MFTKITPIFLTMELSKLLASNLKRLRADAGLSQAALAEAADVSNKLISEIERGITWPREETLIAIADALRAKPAELLLDDELVLLRLKKALKR